MSQAYIYPSSSGSGGTVTSVGVAVPAFLSVSGSPVTTSGTITIGLSGTALPIANGGTGQTTANAAFNALSPMTTGGDIIYGGASGAGTRLANGTAGQVLTSNGTTLAPSWSTPAGTGTVTSVSVVTANGLAGTVATATSTPAITLTTTITGVLKGNGTAISAAVSGTDYSAGTSALATGILKSTTTTGALTIAVAGDFPTLNQNTTGTAANITASSNATLTTLSVLSLPTTQLTGVLAAAQFPALTGDVTTVAGALATTLATVNANVGSFGSSTAIPNFTVNAKGLITAAGTNVVIAPAGTLTGTTLAANVVTSSLTSVGTIATGVWNGTAIAVANGGTGLTTLTTNNVILGNGSSAPTFVAPGTSGNVLTSNGTTWTSAAPSGGGTPSSINLDTFAGYGSTNTIVPYFTNATTQGSDLTLTTNDATSGATITVNTTGTYILAYNWRDVAGGGNQANVAKNPSTPVNSFTTASNIAFGSNAFVVTSNVAQTLTWCGPLTAGDVIVPSNNSAGTNGAVNNIFSITRIR